MQKRKQQKFNEDFKRKVAMEVMHGKWRTVSAAQKVYNIHGNNMIAKWIKYYSLVEDPAKTRDVLLQAMTKQEREEFEILKRKIAELESRLTDETHRSGLYKTMIEIAEEQLNIPIRKKYGAGQYKLTKSTPLQ
jgi:transposase-like protein